MNQVISSVKGLIYFTVLLGFIYPVLIAVLGQSAFPFQTKGSLLIKDGKVVGSELLAQKFESDRYFWPRPSAIDFNTLPSGGSNLGPTSAALKETYVARRAKLGAEAPQGLLFASASGLDPDLSPEETFYQIPRVAKARGMPEETLRSMVRSVLQKRQLGLLGEERVNILKLNLALDQVR